MKKGLIWLIGIVLVIIMLVWALIPKRKAYKKRRKVLHSIVRKRSVSPGVKKYLKKARRSSPRSGSKRRWFYFKGGRTLSAKTWARKMREQRKKK